MPRDGNLARVGHVARRAPDRSLWSRASPARCLTSRSRTTPGESTCRLCASNERHSRAITKTCATRYWCAPTVTPARFSRSNCQRSVGSHAREGGEPTEPRRQRGGFSVHKCSFEFRWTRTPVALGEAERKTRAGSPKRNRPALDCLPTLPRFTAAIGRYPTCSGTGETPVAPRLATVST